MNSAEEFEMEALKTLHDGHLQNLHALSERPFHSVLQTVTLNVAVVAALVAGNVDLSHLGKVLSTSLLALFNLVVIGYVLRQGSLNEEERERYQHIRSSLFAKCPSLPSQVSSQKNVCQGIPLLTGTKSFCVAVASASVLSIAALWWPFVNACKSAVG